LILAPAASGVASVTVPADIVLLKLPPIACVGGSSRTVPKTVTLQGAVAGVPVVEHVPLSVMPFTVMFVDVNARISATLGTLGIELMSITRNRSRVTGAPVLLTKRRLNESVPCAPFVTGVKSRTRFGDEGAPMFTSSIRPAMLDRVTGELMFCGPGAPSR